ncbi:hypothetical protein P4S93_04350 [Aneurinibacillus thermoaerophilus]|nr:MULTISPECIES: hypothetical protein [Aneurinibacillus]MED0676217.1 hypothetical protein [Aneurinibacillus thermoaerophilus]MED0678149.1 hypothetical protein [Aneurinibacillus thermoaerophilus]MED0755657.1 hypothetical protein [Aneurinibacillus thermoaerophilus]MED0760014.1 hypothetical protein [Aneurinibacillus thermoaerophilus]
MTRRKYSIDFKKQVVKEAKEKKRGHALREKQRQMACYSLFSGYRQGPS